MRTPNRLLGLVLGLGLVVLGVLRLLLDSGAGFFAPRGTLLFGALEGNAALGILHILLGAALAMAALSSVRYAATVNAAIGALLLLLGLAGLFLVGTDANMLAVNVADNALHFGAAAVLLAAGLGLARPEPATS